MNRVYVLALLAAAGCSDEVGSTVEGDCSVIVLGRPYAYWGPVDGGSSPLGSNAKCVASPLVRHPDGWVQCVVTETPADPEITCADIASRGRDPIPVGRREDGRVVCRVHQVVSLDGQDPGLPGFYYEEGAISADLCGGYDEPAALHFSESGKPLDGSEIELECIASWAGDCGF